MPRHPSRFDVHSDGRSEMPTTNNELHELRTALAARVQACWDHLEDVVDELVTLHGVAPDSIRERVAEIARGECEGVEAVPLSVVRSSTATT